MTIAGAIRSRNVLNPLASTKYDIPCYSYRDIQKAISGLLLKPRPARIVIANNIVVEDTLMLGSTTQALDDLTIECVGASALYLQYGKTRLFSNNNTAGLRSLRLKNITAYGLDSSGAATYVPTFAAIGLGSSCEISGCRVWCDTFFSAAASLGFSYSEITGNTINRDGASGSTVAITIAKAISTLIDGNRALSDPINITVTDAESCSLSGNSLDGGDIILSSGNGECVISNNRMNGGDITTSGTSGLNTIIGNTDVGTITAHATDIHTGLNT